MECLWLCFRPAGGETGQELSITCLLLNLKLQNKPNKIQNFTGKRLNGPEGCSSPVCLRWFYFSCLTSRSPPPLWGLLDGTTHWLSQRSFSLSARFNPSPSSPPAGMTHFRSDCHLDRREYHTSASVLVNGLGSLGSLCVQHEGLQSREQFCVWSFSFFVWSIVEVWTVRTFLERVCYLKQINNKGSLNSVRPTYDGYAECLWMKTAAL